MSGDRPAVSDRVILEEGEDYSLAGGIPTLTKAGFQRMAAAHAIGRADGLSAPSERRGKGYSLGLMSTSLRL